MRSRAEHLAWCKERALQYLELPQPDSTSAVASMMNDLSQHEDFKDQHGAGTGHEDALSRITK
jgi:hypothetical protein